MPLPVIPGVVRCSVSGVVPSLQRWTNVWHFRYAGGASSPGTTDITALHALFVRFYAGTAFGAGVPWMSQAPTAVTIDTFNYVILDGSALGQVIGVSLAGSQVSGAIPSECAPVLTLRSAQRGRSHRGRVYLPTPAQGKIDAGGRLLAASATATVAQGAGLMTALGGALVSPFWEIGVASYLLHVFTPLATFTMDTDIDVQRRRKK